MGWSSITSSGNWTWTYNHVGSTTLVRTMLSYTNDNDYPVIINSCYLTLGTGKGTFSQGDTVSGSGLPYTVYATASGINSNTLTISNIVNTSYSGVEKKTFSFNSPVIVNVGSKVNITFTFVGSGTGCIVIAHGRNNSSYYGGTVSKSQCTVSYKANGGSGTAPSSHEVTIGTTIQLRQNTFNPPTSAQHTLTLYDESQIVSAEFDGNTFRDWIEGSASGSTYYAAGASYTANKSVNMYARWNSHFTLPELPDYYSYPKGYTVTLNLMGGSCNTTSIRATDTITYYHSGWDGPSNSGVSFSTTASIYMSNDYTLYASWESTYVDGPVTLPAASQCTKSGYKLAGWSTSSSATTKNYNPGETFTPTKNITVYAVWEVDNYTVTYHSNNIYNETDVQTAKIGSSVTIRDNNFTKEEFTASGYKADFYDEKGNFIETKTATNIKIDDFYYWSLEPYDANPIYHAGESQTFNKDTDLYAINSSKIKELGSIEIPYLSINPTYTYCTITFNRKNQNEICNTSSLQSQKETTYTCTKWKGNSIEAIPGSKVTLTSNQTFNPKVETTTGSYNSITLPEASRPNSEKSISIYYYDYNGSLLNNSTMSQTSKVYYQYDFNGWWTANNAKYIGTSGDKYQPTGDIILYTNFIENVTYDYTQLYDATKEGYYLLGWSKTKNSDSIDYDPFEVVEFDTDTSLYAVWGKNSGTPYVVNHWKQKLNATSTTQSSTNYTLIQTENLAGYTDETISPSVRSYTGFTSPSKQTTTIAADGSTVVNYYYTRNSYTFTLGTDIGVSTSGSSSTGTYKYEETINLVANLSTGYKWNKWTSNNTNLLQHLNEQNTSFTMPAGNITVTPDAEIYGSVVIYYNGRKMAIPYVRIGTEWIQLLPYVYTKEGWKICSGA